MTAIMRRKPARTVSGGEARFLREIQGFPMIEASEEVRLARRWRDTSDPAALEPLVNSHLRLVAMVARRHLSYGVPLADLMSEGTLGLIHAARRFDPERGFRLSTYALWWIRAAIQEYILHSWSLVKIGTTSSQKRLFFGLRAARHRIAAMEDGELGPKTAAVLAERFKVSASEIVEMNRRMAAPDQSLNAPISAEGESDSWQDRLVDDAASQEDALAEREEQGRRRQMLVSALKRLDGREQHILVERQLKEPRATLATLSYEYGISRERVRQLEMRALAKLRAEMHHASVAVA
jgi:RNA polymerase sigma-32 factor